MNPRRIVASQSVFWFVFAILLLIVPRQLLALLGPVPGPLGIFVARLFGAELTALAIASWVARSLADTPAGRALFAAYLASNALGFVVTLTATLRGDVNALGWFFVVLYGAYAAAFAVLFRRPRD